MTVISRVWVYMLPFPVWTGSVLAWPFRRLFFNFQLPRQQMSEEWQAEVLSRIKRHSDDHHSGHSY